MIRELSNASDSMGFVVVGVVVRKQPPPKTQFSIGLWGIGIRKCEQALKHTIAMTPAKQASCGKPHCSAKKKASLKREAFKCV